MGLNPVSQGDLELLVADEIGCRLARQEWFTAYDITQALRAAHPSALILHAAVRSTVHAQLEAAVANGLYERETASYSTGSAVRYMPK